jgi:hypothetical protein
MKVFDAYLEPDDLSTRLDPNKSAWLSAPIINSFGHSLECRRLAAMRVAYLANGGVMPAAMRPVLVIDTVFRDPMVVAESEFSAVAQARAQAPDDDDVEIVTDLAASVEEEGLKKAAHMRAQSLRCFTAQRKLCGIPDGAVADMNTYDAVFLPTNVGDAHWVLLVAYPREKRLVLYDSLPKYTTPAMIYTAVMRANHILGAEYEHVISNTAPAQNDSSSCGLFVCNAMQAVTERPGADAAVVVPPLQSPARYREYLKSQLLLFQNLDCDAGTQTAGFILNIVTAMKSGQYSAAPVAYVPPIVTVRLMLDICGGADPGKTMYMVDFSDTPSENLSLIQGATLNGSPDAILDCFIVATAPNRKVTAKPLLDGTLDVHVESVPEKVVNGTTPVRTFSLFYELPGSADPVMTTTVQPVDTTAVQLAQSTLKDFDKRPWFKWNGKGPYPIPDDLPAEAITYDMFAKVPQGRIVVGNHDVVPVNFHGPSTIRAIPLPGFATADVYSAEALAHAQATRPAGRDDDVLLCLVQDTVSAWYCVPRGAQLNAVMYFLGLQAATEEIQVNNYMWITALVDAPLTDAVTYCTVPDLPMYR